MTPVNSVNISVQPARKPAINKENVIIPNLVGFKILPQIYYPELTCVALGGLVVSVLATEPKVRGFKPGRGRWILRVIKSIARLPSEGK
jgi:hypothetical protein